MKGFSSQQITIMVLLHLYLSRVMVLLLVLLLQMQQELNRSNIVQAQAQRERDAMERLMKKKQDDFFDKLEAIHVQLQAVEEEANLKMQEVEERCNRDIERYKVRFSFFLSKVQLHYKLVSAQDLQSYPGPFFCSLSPIF
jgi:replication-associated recombination protein RarA